MLNNVGLYLGKRAHLNPNVEAIVDVATDRRFSFREVDERANAIANAMLAKGIKKGDRVAILMMNGVEFFECFMGLAKIGAISVPLNWRLVADELTYILKDAGAVALIYGGDFGAVVAEIHGRGDDTDITCWIENSQGATQQLFADAYDDVLAGGSTQSPEITAGGDDDVFIMYTSGTTGLPKGAQHSHNTLTWALITANATWDMRPKDRYSIALPMYHIGALLPVALTAYTGATAVLMREFNPKLMWELIESERINSTLAVPAMLNFMLMVPDFDKYDLSSLRLITSGASPVPVSLIEKYRDIGVEIHQLYGLTEACGPGTMISAEDAMERIGSAGKGFFHTSVRVVNKAGDDVAPGEPGELLVKSAHIMKGYWNNPKATAETIRDGWLHTGDIALCDADGFITIHDRVKDMVISGGENVYPAELENVIMSCPGVADVAVIGQASERWGESPFAVVVRNDDNLAEADILKHCDGKLARFKQPKGAVFIDEIPRNPTGKPLKRILREQFPGPARE
ncbi:MAG: long-chain fatty acid--CoA ligase [Rhodospirillaceae bacterium]|jgi:acyl-CoA synthetase (AMP-forming)/AMP-acid ligase II|nr:long-chain fatty acid--CoA ligase [Rhodospirillaceae bacterium]MBT5079960.1 long-chain fatty acid--CoA ligase [Rhodospirillaceae bacterium]MBT5525982.1 long-chain fatty acid--CoA ligase [Rhodospirillaceae bacterium]MBT5881771.1 long-chain fatty acid--CoA ligase [Rhodospirillaceae bacterium]MBT6588874.1 long-chain fatty acid--CoA ligase [Rhodospirillaceae bacterium]